MQHPLSPYRLYLFDVDGTLRGCHQEGQSCPHRPEDWYLLPHVKDTLAQYQWHTQHHWSLITNQAGAALGLLDAPMCTVLLGVLCDACALPLPWAWEVCMHHPQAGCACRKPSPYLLLHAAAKTALPLWETLYIGDRARDREAAARAGIAYMPAQEFFGWA